MQGDLFSEAPGIAAQQKATKAPAPAPAQPADHAQREAAVTCFERPIMLEAGAGTGKTATLVARIVSWCMGLGWEASLQSAPKPSPEEQAAAVLNSIAAITFTEAAAAEMSTRVAQALGLLEQASKEGEALDAERLPIGLARQHLPASLEAIRTRSAALRGSLEHLNISTIHSFCRRLLAANPLEVGMAPGFGVDASGLGQRAAVRAAMEAYLAEAWQDPIDPDLLNLARERQGAPEIEGVVLKLLSAGARCEDFERDPFDALTVETLLSDLDAAAKPLAAILGGKFGALPSNQKVHALIETLGEILSILSLAESEGSGKLSPAEHFDELCTQLNNAWSERAKSKLKEYATGTLLKGEEKLIGDEQEALFEATRSFEAASLPLYGLRPAFLNCGRRVLQSVLGAAQARMRSQGLASYSDLLYDAHRLLMEHPAIAAAERRRMGMLMVDEFQDTDQKQCDLVRAIALEGPEEQRPSLFIVGDPKQSIFSWRGADLAAYDDFKAHLQAAGGEVLQLTCNFRSRPSVLAEVTRLMQSVMLAEPGMQPPYVPLVAQRQDAPASPSAPPIEHWVSWPEDLDTGGVRVGCGRLMTPSYRAEARAIAADILARHHEHAARWQDFALLFRSMNQLEAYLGELRSLGIPFEVQSDRSYYRRREIIDASALVRAALDPSDLLALVTLLRSPMVGLPDAALLPLWARGFPAQVAELERPDERRLARLREDLEQVAALLPSSIPGLDAIRGWEEGVLAALCSLAELRASFDGSPGTPALSIDAWLDLLRAHFQPAASEAARYLGAYRLGNLERFFDELLASFEESKGDKQALLRVLRTNTQRNERVDARTSDESQSDTVKLLTIHSSKGLEFNNVYLPQLHRDDEAGNRSGRDGFDRRSGLFSYQIFGAGTPNRAQGEVLRQRTERAERVRLFYVGLTRAKERLVLLSDWGAGAKSKPWDEAKRYSELLAHRSGQAEVLRALESQAPARDASPQFDASGAAWRLAALIPGQAHPQGHRAVGIELPSIAETAAKLSRLAEQRAQAEAYGRRPFTGQASLRAEGEPAANGAEFDESSLLSGTVEPSAASPGLSPASAMRVGSEVHRLLENYQSDLNSHDGLQAALGSLSEDLRPQERLAVEEILCALASNGILERLRELEPHIIARELPALLTPSDDPKGPTGFVSAALDLVYRDPESKEIVVVDFKTDRTQGQAEVLQRAASYRSQGLSYVRALREALALDYDPRLEFWFLRSGQVATLQR